MKGRTYRYLDKEPLFPFGFGLSYTQFEYSDLKLSKTLLRKGRTDFTVSVRVQNTGAYEAEEVVQLYLKDEFATVEVPNYALKDFKRITLNPGSSTTVTFEVTPAMLEMIDKEGARTLERGKFTVFVCGSLPTQRSLDLGAANFLSAEFKVK